MGMPSAIMECMEPTGQRSTNVGAESTLVGRQPVISLHPIPADEPEHIAGQVSGRDEKIVSGVMIDGACAASPLCGFEMVDVQVVERSNVPAAVNQAKAEIIFLGRHEEGAIKAPDFPKGAGPEADTAADEDVGKGAALFASIRQKDTKACGTEFRLIGKVLEHSIHGVRPWERVVVQEDNEVADRPIHSEGLGAASEIGPKVE